MSLYDKIETTRLLGTKIALDDFDYLYQINTDLQVAKTMGGTRTKEQTKDRLDLWLAHWNQYGYGIWLIRKKNTDRFVGRAGLHHYNIDGLEEIELLYAILPQFWNQGFTTEISEKIIDLAFHEFHIESLVCFTLPENLASRRVMEKLGFVYEKDIIHVGFPHVLYRLCPH